jgi:Secretion system C-terminal sorting domain
MVSAQPPVITQDISNFGSCATNGYAFLYLIASNANAYTWQVSTDGGNTWATLTDNASYTVTSPPYLFMNTAPSWDHYKYRGIVSNSFGADTSSVATLFITSTAPGTAVFVNPPTEVCQGSTQVFHVTNVSPADTIVWFAQNQNISPNAVIDDSTVLISFPNSATSQEVIISFILNGCGQNFTPVRTTLTVNPLQSTPAGTAGGGDVCAIYSVYPGAATIYSDGTCNPIAAVTPSGASPVSGTVQSCVTVDASVQSFNGLPYVQRHYSLEPSAGASTATATVTLYFTQADFDAYNLARGSSPALPTGPSDATGIGNLHITQFHGNGSTPDTYVGGSGDIVPATVWNSTASRWELTFDITGFSGFFASGGSIIPLPLTLTDFTGMATTTGNLLHWETAMEENTDYFEVQRSAAGSGFRAIATVPAAGNSDQPLSYSYTDLFAGAPVPSYAYRLKMADLDGKFMYSKIVTLSSSFSGLSIRISPNPFHQPVAVTVTAPQAGQGSLTVTDVSGKKILVQAVALQAGENSLDASLIAALPQGMYFLSIITDREKQTVKFIKD